MASSDRDNKLFGKQRFIAIHFHKNSLNITHLVRRSRIVPKYESLFMFEELKA
jgi:hypothetical protein